MTLHRIKNSILTEARKEAERIREVGRKHADEKFRKAEEQLRRQFEQRVGDFENKQKDMVNRAVIALRSSLSMELLAAKNELIDKIFDKAVENIISLPDNGYRELLAKWLKESASSEPAQLLLNDSDRKAFGEQLVTDANKVRASDAALTLAEEALPVRGGFVLRAARYEIDRSLDSLIAKLKEEMAPMVASQLFASRVERIESK